MARETDMSQRDIDEKLAALEVEEEVEVEVEPEEEEVEEEVEATDTEDDTDDDEPSPSEGDEDDEEDVELTEEEDGLLKTAIAERKKRQEKENELREIKETLQKLQETVVNAQAPRTLEDAYDRDPKGVIENINANIAQAVDSGDTLEAERLRDLKLDLQNSSARKQQLKQQQEQKQTEIATLLFSKIPDYGPEKQRELTKFAVEKLGYDIKDLADRTNLDKLGVDAVKEIIRIDTAFKKLQIPGNAQKKKVKKATVVEKGGKGIKKTVVNEVDLIKRAKKSGDKDDWAAVIEARLG